MKVLRLLATIIGLLFGNLLVQANSTYAAAPPPRHHSLRVHLLLIFLTIFIGASLPREG